MLLLPVFLQVALMSVALGLSAGLLKSKATTRPSFSNTVVVG